MTTKVRVRRPKPSTLIVPAAALCFLWLGGAHAALDVAPDAPGPEEVEAGSTAAFDFAAAEAMDASLDALLSKAASDGSVRVIAMFEEPASAGSDVERTEAVASFQDAVVSQVEAHALSPIRRFTYTAGIAFETDGAGVQALLADPNVVSVQEDTLNAPALYDAIPLIDADDAWALGFQGSGKTVAILDTGVNESHPFLDSGKVVSEACYSTTSGTRSTSLCPGGVSSSTASGSGADCDLTFSGCGHGTHVAGIAAGFAGASSKGTIYGVGRRANVIAVKVFSRFDSSSDCSPAPAPCVLAYTSDVIAGLERVYALRNSYDIASANMSLGGGRFTGDCDTDSRKPIIDQLRNAGIATVASAGNSSYRDAMGAPACISTAISVASSDKDDTYSSFTNVSPTTDVIAPGGSICSSVNGSPNCGGSGSTGFGFKSGTSMSAPMVAGAWAVMKSKNGFASVSSVESALEASGKSLTDDRTGGTLTKPRIDLDGALARLGAGPSRGFYWDHCQHVWQSGSTTWCWLKAGGFWISSSNDLWEEQFIKASASRSKTSNYSHYVGYNVTSTGTIDYIRIWEY